MVSQDYVPIVEPCCEQNGAHLIDIVLRGKQSRPVVEILIDAESGVTSDLCSAVSRDVAKMLDEWDRIPEAYTLIVSSPGIEKPLKFSWQYRKHVGRRFVLKVQDESGVRELTGKLLSTDDEGVSLEIGKGNETATFRFEQIIEAVVKSPW